MNYKTLFYLKEITKKGDANERKSKKSRIPTSTLSAM